MSYPTVLPCPASPTTVRVEIMNSDVLPDGRLTFTVDQIAADGERCTVWACTDYGEAILAAGACAGHSIPVDDRVGMLEPD